MKLKRKKLRARVEMTPLMDVVFLLLVFFIYSMISMTVHRAIPLNLPSSSQAELRREIGLALSVASDGALFLNKEPITRDGLIARLLTEQAGISGEGLHADGRAAGEISIEVFADGDLHYQELYKVLDMIKAAGVSKITLQAKGQSAAP